MTRLNVPVWGIRFEDVVCSSCGRMNLTPQERGSRNSLVGVDRVQVLSIGTLRARGGGPVGSNEVDSIGPLMQMVTAENHLSAPSVRSLLRVLERIGEDTTNRVGGRLCRTSRSGSILGWRVSNVDSRPGWWRTSRGLKRSASSRRELGALMHLDPAGFQQLQLIVSTDDRVSLCGRPNGNGHWGYWVLHKWDKQGVGLAVDYNHHPREHFGPPGPPPAQQAYIMRVPGWLFDLLKPIWEKGIAMLLCWVPTMDCQTEWSNNSIDNRLTLTVPFPNGSGPPYICNGGYASNALGAKESMASLFYTASVVSATCEAMTAGHVLVGSRQLSAVRPSWTTQLGELDRMLGEVDGSPAQKAAVAHAAVFTVHAIHMDGGRVRELIPRRTSHVAAANSMSLGGSWIYWWQIAADYPVAERGCGAPRLTPSRRFVGVDCRQNREASIRTDTAGRWWVREMAQMYNKFSGFSASDCQEVFGADIRGAVLRTIPTPDVIETHAPPPERSVGETFIGAIRASAGRYTREVWDGHGWVSVPMYHCHPDPNDIRCLSSGVWSRPSFGWNAIRWRVSLMWDDHSYVTLVDFRARRRTGRAVAIGSYVVPKRVVGSHNADHSRLWNGRRWVLPRVGNMCRCTTGPYVYTEQGTWVRAADGAICTLSGAQWIISRGIIEQGQRQREVEPEPPEGGDTWHGTC